MLRINSTARSGCAGLSLFFVLAIAGQGEPEQDGLPSAHEKARYDALRTHSPFSLASTAPAAAAPQASFAATWFVSGIARIGDADFVSIKSRDLSTQFSLYAHEPDPDTHVSLASVNWSDTVGKSTVVLRKGTETALLEFNEDEIRAVATTPAAPAAPPAKPPVGPVPPRGMVPPFVPPNNPSGAGTANSGVGTPDARKRAAPIQPPR